MREIVQADTFSPSTGASTEAALRVDSPEQKQANSISSTERQRRVQRALWETSLFDCAALKALNLPSPSIGGVHNDHFCSRAESGACS